MTKVETNSRAVALRQTTELTEPTEPTETELAAQPTIGLALGGGGARGLAHILMLEALDEMGVRPKAITGTSIGAIFGACYAAGLAPATIRAFTEDALGARFDLLRQLFASRADPVSKLLNLLPVRGSLLKAESLLDLILPDLVPRDFDGLSIPLKIVATDFYAQTPVIFDQGPLRRAIAASMALPAIFSPVMIDERAHMDGGMVNPLPFDLIEACDIIIAIDVTGTVRAGDPATPPSAFNALIASSQIFQSSIIREKLKSTQPDIYIDVDVNQFLALEFHKVGKILKAAEPAKQKLKDELARHLGAYASRGASLPATRTAAPNTADTGPDTALNPDKDQ